MGAGATLRNWMHSQTKISVLQRKQPQWARWLRAIIPASPEADIRKIMVQSQVRQIVHKTLSQKYKWSGGVAQGLDPEFN
jgi:hypothetical protein